MAGFLWLGGCNGGWGGETLVRSSMLRLHTQMRQVGIISRLLLNDTFSAHFIPMQTTHWTVAGQDHAVKECL